MLIEKPEELKLWLTSHLQPLCDADPAALSKYVLALIKKDKTEAELRESMCQQMDVFLQSETQSFVDKLFAVVDSKEYITQTQIKEEDLSDNVSADDSRVGDKEPKIEADSTTPSREDERYSEPRPTFEERRPRPSPPYGRRITNRLGPRESRESMKRFRSRSRSNSRELSPRHDRFRSARRRSPSPNFGRRRSLDVTRRTRSAERERPNSRDSTPTRDEGATGYTPTVKKIRCRDYDEKGFCLRGDLCKFDHGNDAVVLEDSAKAAGYQPAGHSEPYIPGLPLGGIPFPPPVLSVPPPGYNQPRGKRSFEGGFEPPAKRFDYPRVSRGRGRGRGWGGRGGRGGNTMLAVRNIPGELNTITHLNGHFCRYGNLVNIQVQFEGDPGSALITFSSPEEASAAYTTSEAVMNNRFIKVFWHHMDKGNVKDRLGKQHLVNANMVVIGQETEVKEESIEKNKDSDDSEKLKVEKAQAILAIQKNQEMLQSQQDMMKKVEEKRKHALVKQEELLKSKHDLLDGLIEQQKALIVKLEKGKGIIKAEEKSKIMKLLKDLSSSIDRTKEDIKTSLSVNRNAADIQKELLDAEIELFALQQEGTDSNDLEIKVNHLRMEAAKAGLGPAGHQPSRGRGFRGRGRGYHQYLPRGATSYVRGARGRGRGRGFSMGSTNLDRRPSSIQVSGYEIEDKEEILEIFNKFGEVLETIEDEGTPSLIIKYKTRPQAEAAMADVKNLHDKNLILAWFSKAQGNDSERAVPEVEDNQDEEEDDGYTPPQDDYLPPGLQEHEDSLGHASKDDNAEGLNETGDGDGSEIFNEDLLDEDDEDGDEERSWKRRTNDDD